MQCRTDRSQETGTQMITLEPAARKGSARPNYEAASAPAAGAREPVSTLRGAGVEVDGRLVGRILAGILLVSLAVMVAVMFVAGAQKNAQIDGLRQHGVAVEVTVTRCMGLLGGSGSNAAGYVCSGTFTLDGRRFHGTIPGNTIRDPGTQVRAVTIASDPGLLSTVSGVKTEHASWRVFVLPSALLVVLALLVGAFVLRRRHTLRA
jgi:hypothetical protein